LDQNITIRPPNKKATAVSEPRRCAGQWPGER